MSHNLGPAWMSQFTSPLSISFEPNCKATVTKKVCSESGIESDFESKTKPDQQNESFGKPIITGSVYIPPQASSSKLLPMPKANVTSPIELVVIYRGKVQFPYPVPTDRAMRTRMMKMYAKTLQNSDHSRFVSMQIDEESIKLYSLRPPKELLFEIKGRQLDLVRQSRKDVSFFYFTTRSKSNLSHDSETVSPSVGSNSNFSGFTCFAFHGNCPKTADKAHRLIKHFVDTNFVSLTYGLDPNHSKMSELSCSTNDTPCVVSNTPATSSLAPVDSVLTEYASVPPETTTSVSTVDLLLNIDDFSVSSNNNLSMFDDLTSTSNLNKPSVPKETEKLLQGLFNSHETVRSTTLSDNPFVPHGTYDNQTTDLLTSSKTVSKSSEQYTNSSLQINSILNGFKTTAPASIHKHSPQPTFMNPLVMSSLNVPLAPTKLSTNPTVQPSNPFVSNVKGTFPQYPTASSNPFSTSFNDQSNQSLSFGSDFNDFLSETVKNHFKK